MAAEEEGLFKADAVNEEEEEDWCLLVLVQYDDVTSVYDDVTYDDVTYDDVTEILVFIGTCSVTTAPVSASTKE